MASDYTILVNSTDSFEDCWVPFFTLIKAFWPDCDKQIILNTETKDFSFPGLNIICSKVGRYYKGKKRPPWGWCLKKCLEQVDSDIILYLQEDYFLEGDVDHKQITEFAEFMSQLSFSHQDTSHIGLTHFGNHSPFGITEHPLLWEIDRYSKYRLSLQAGLWKTISLLKYIQDNDTGWNLEEVGSYRAQRIDERLLTVNRHIFKPGGKAIFPYTHTGIIRGKWNKEAVVDLFAHHDLKIDFSIRGFYSQDYPTPNRSLIGRIKGKTNRIINNVKMKINYAIDNFRSI